MNWLYLSYPLNDQTFGYGNGERFKLKSVRSMCCGDTSNNSVFSMPTHFGTHIDFPFHFDSEGKKSSDYKAEDFVFKNVQIVDISSVQIEGYLIQNEHLNEVVPNKETDFLIVKTGFCTKRHLDEYWEKGLGFHPECAAYLKKRLPNLKVIGFDLISLNSYQERPTGRIAHKAFLIEQDILILEEMNLEKINVSTQIEEMIVAPLQLENADGAPCTVLTKIKK